MEEIKGGIWSFAELARRGGGGVIRK